MQKQKVLSTLDEIKAISDPYRIKILDCIRKNNEAKTVKEVADVLGEVPAKVYYHIKKLEKAGIVELSHTKVINGIVAKYYRLTAEEFSVGVNSLKEPITKAVKAQTAFLISQIYEESEKIFLNEFQNDNDNLSSPGMGLSTTVYLSEEENSKFKDLIIDFLKEHKEEADGKSKHHVFIVDVKMTE